LIYAYMLWVVFDLLLARNPNTGSGRIPHATFSVILVVLVYLMILSGGLVAGTRAGFAYSTWPLMGVSFIPEGLYTGTPAWLSAFEDITTIQFNHRMFAYLLFVLISALVVLLYRRGVQGRVRVGLALLMAALLAQLTLGISTLLLHVPVSLAAAHQGGAVVLLTAMLYVSHALVRP
jgi:cytochrome c oxidase assembly protein subunit 15